MLHSVSPRPYVLPNAVDAWQQAMTSKIFRLVGRLIIRLFSASSTGPYHIMFGPALEGSTSQDQSLVWMVLLPCSAAASLMGWWSSVGLSSIGKGFCRERFPLMELWQAGVEAVANSSRRDYVGPIQSRSCVMSATTSLKQWDSATPHFWR